MKITIEICVKETSWLGSAEGVWLISGWFFLFGFAFNFGYNDRYIDRPYIDILRLLL